MRTSTSTSATSPCGEGGTLPGWPGVNPPCGGISREAADVVVVVGCAPPCGGSALSEVGSGVGSKDVG